MLKISSPDFSFSPNQETARGRVHCPNLIFFADVSYNSTVATGAFAANLPVCSTLTI